MLNDPILTLTRCTLTGDGASMMLTHCTLSPDGAWAGTGLAALNADGATRRFTFVPANIPARYFRLFMTPQPDPSPDSGWEHGPNRMTFAP